MFNARFPETTFVPSPSVIFGVGSVVDVESNFVSFLSITSNLIVCSPSAPSTVIEEPVSCVQFASSILYRTKLTPSSSDTERYRVFVLQE